MKINFVSFTDFDSEIEVYDLKKMDLFIYLLVEIINKGSNKTIKEVLLDLDVTNSLMYLYQNKKRGLILLSSLYSFFILQMSFNNGIINIYHFI